MKIKFWGLFRIAVSAFIIAVLSFAATSHAQLRPQIGMDKPFAKQTKERIGSAPLSDEKALQEESEELLEEEWPEEDAETPSDLEGVRKRTKEVFDREENDSEIEALRNLQRPVPRDKSRDSRQRPLEREAGEQSRRPRDRFHRDRRMQAEREEFSPTEKLFFGKFPGAISRELKQFGYDLFNQETENFMALENVPISPDYTVGPGDVFSINVWGSTNFSRKVTVRRDGSIFIPKIGTLSVWGLSYKEMNEKIEKKLSKFFSGVKVSIGLENIRMLNIFVVGEVEKPGSYTIPSTSTAINALFYAGGPTKRGSLRDVRIVRNNKEIAKVDLYDFLISGINSRQQLQSQDVILVPVIGKVAAIAGNVKRPGIYEVKSDTSLFDAITLGGGLSFTGQIGRISLERVKENKERIVQDFHIPNDFKSLKREEAIQTDLGTKIQDGDLIQIFPILPTFSQTVYLRGHVKRPGSYEFKEGMTLKDLIPSYDALMPEPYTEYLQIIRTVPPKDELQAIFTSLGKLMKDDPQANVTLQDKDVVIVFSKDELNLREKVTVEGKVNKPGEYLYFEGMRLKDLLFMAGNLRDDAYLANAEIARYKVLDKELKFERLQVNLHHVLANDPKANIPLQPKDKIFIQGLPNWELENFIVLHGEVRFPGRYSFGPQERLSSILDRAGGFTERAFLPGAIFTRRSVKALQEQSLKEQISKLEEAVLQESVKSTQTTTENFQSYQEAIVARRAMLKNLQDVEATGRMVIRVSKLEDFKNSKFDIRLEPEDTLTIPPIPSVVSIQGEVFNPTSIVYDEGKTIQYYLNQAGGTTQNADNSNILLIHADGTVVSRSQNRGFLLRNFYQMKVERGDTILVPKDITRFSWLATTKDLTEILFKIASTTGITITAFK